MEELNSPMEVKKENKWLTKDKALSLLFFTLSFAVPAVLLMLIWGSQGISYGGKVTLLTYDMEHQYVQFLYSLRYLLKDPTQILFNWNFGYGGNYTGVFAYYLSSPLNLITLFWNIENFPDAIYCLMLLKTSLCGVSFYILLTYFEKGTKLINILFSTCYALMSYNIAYGMCIMWTDAIILLPIVIIGVERILAGKKGLVYFFSITAVFITNYYMAYFIGVFVALYFLLRLLLEIEENKSKKSLLMFFRIGVNTLFGLGIAMPIILPSLFCIKKYSAKSFEGGFADQFYQGRIVEKLKMLLPSQYCTLRFGGLPYIFCGLFIFVLAAAFFIQKRKAREKLFNACLLALISIGFLSQKADYLWHGFRYPTGFNYRYSFLFSFIIILTAYKAIKKIPIQNKNVNFIVLVFSLYTLAELFMNGTAIISGLQQEFEFCNRSRYNVENSIYKPLADEVLKDANFGRVKSKCYILGYNQNIMYNLKGTDFYSSINPKNVNEFIVNMGGVDVNSNLMTLSGSILPTIDSILGIKYSIAPVEQTKIYEKKKQSDVDGVTFVSLYENVNSIGLGCGINRQNDYSLVYENNPFINRMNFLKLFGIENSNVFTGIEYAVSWNKINSSESTINIAFTPQSSDSIYFYVDMDINGLEDCMVYLNDQVMMVTGSKSAMFLNDLIIGKEYNIKIKGNYTDLREVYLCEFNNIQYEEEIKRITELNQLTNIVSKGNQIYADFQCNDTILLFTSLPYDDGYSIFIDGKKQKYIEIANTFVGVEVEPGMHHIKIVYIPQGLKLGISIFILSLFSICVYYRKKQFD